MDTLPPIPQRENHYCKLTPQLTYVATVLDIDTKIIDTIQDMINSFVLNIKPGGRHWISKDLLYETTKKGALASSNLQTLPEQ